LLRKSLRQGEPGLNGPDQHPIGHHLEFHGLVVVKPGLTGDGGGQAHPEGISPAAKILAREQASHPMPNVYS
jgi:hypothetical protein